MMPKAIFFDAAGTLFDARVPVGHTYWRIARGHGLKADEGRVVAGFNRAFASAPVIAFGTGHPASELRTLEREWWRAVVGETFKGLGAFDDFDGCFTALFAFFADPANWRVDPDAIAALEALKRAGLVLGVISNFDFRLYHILQGLGLSRFFDSITISSEAGYAKPRREIFDVALTRHRVAASDAIYVGDSYEHDFVAARAIGFRAMLLDKEKPSAVLDDSGSARINSLAYLNTVTQKL